MVKLIVSLARIIEVLFTQSSQRARRGRNFVQWHLYLQAIMLIALHYQQQELFVGLFIVYVLLTYQIIVDGIKCLKKIP